jgi:hypothetical protein
MVAWKIVQWKKKKVKTVVKRTNDVFFFVQRDISDKRPTAPNGAEEFKKIPNYSLIAYEYSGIVKVAICDWAKCAN